MSGGRTSRPHEDARPDLHAVVDATEGWGRLEHGYAARAGAFSRIDPASGIPYVEEKAEGFWDPAALVFHDLQRSTPGGFADRRLAPALVVDWDAPYASARAGDAGLGQDEAFTALNRSSRLRDRLGRVAITTGLLRVVGAEDGRYAPALTCGTIPLGGAGAAPGAAALSPEVLARAQRDGVHFEPGAAAFKGTAGNLTLLGAAADAARDAYAAGASADDAMRAGLAVAQGLPPPEKRTALVAHDRHGNEIVVDEHGRDAWGRKHDYLYEPKVNKVTAGGKTRTRDARPTVAPRERPAGYVVDDAGKVGLLGTVFYPSGAGTFFVGTEGVAVGPLPIRHDAQFVMAGPLAPPPPLFGSSAAGSAARRAAGKKARKKKRAGRGGAGAGGAGGGGGGGAPGPAPFPGELGLPEEDWTDEHGRKHRGRKSLAGRFGGLEGAGGIFGGRGRERDPGGGGAVFEDPENFFGLGDPDSGAVFSPRRTRSVPPRGGQRRGVSLGADVEGGFGFGGEGPDAGVELLPPGARPGRIDVGFGGEE